MCTSVAEVILYGLTPVALEGSLCTKRTFLWVNSSAEILSYAFLGFYYRVRSLGVCFTCPKYLVLPLCLALQSRLPSPRPCQQLGGTKGLAFVPTYRLLFQVSDFARNMTGSEQRCRPLFSWSRCLCLLLVHMYPLEVLGEGGYGSWLLSSAMNMVKV